MGHEKKQENIIHNQDGVGPSIQTNWEMTDKAEKEQRTCGMNEKPIAKLGREISKSANTDEKFIVLFW